MKSLIVAISFLVASVSFALPVDKLILVLQSPQVAAVTEGAYIESIGQGPGPRCLHCFGLSIVQYRDGATETVKIVGSVSESVGWLDVSVQVNPQ